MADHALTAYSKYARDIDGHNDTIVQVISHYGVPVIDFGVGDDTIYTTLPYTLNAGADYSSYTWNDTVGIRTHEAGSGGWYKLEVTDIHSCYAVDSVFIANNTSIGDAIFPDAGLKVYPNPANNLLHIEFESADDEVLYLELFDALGRKIHAKEYHHVKGIIETLDVSNIPKGIIYLRIRQDEQQAIRKIIIE